MKIKRIFLSFLMIISMFCVVACKDKGGSGDDDTSTPPAKQDSVVNATYDSAITRFAGDKLSTVELVLGVGSTDGVLSWDNPEAVLELGTNSYGWNFVPTDTTKYNAKAGTLSIYARVPLEIPEVTGVNIVSGQTIYIDSPLSYVELDSAFNCVQDGTIEWENPNQVLVEGDNTCTWVFSPANDDVYAKVKGDIVVTATAEQTLTKLSVASNTKNSGYVAYDEFDFSGLTINFEYNAGKVVPTQLTKYDCSVIYENGDSLKKGDTSVTLLYKSSYTCVVPIEEVGFKIIEKPTFTNTVVYDGFERILTVETSKHYTYNTLQAINAGEYDLVLTLSDTDNLKWSDSETAETIVKCYIQEADNQVSSVEFTGIYDGEAHSSTISGGNVDEVYYSTSPLNEENYLSADTEEIGFVNAGTYTVYYYAVGSVNYKDVSGVISVSIQKQTPVVNLEYLYTLYTGQEVHYPTEYVTVLNQQSEEISKGDLRFTYYQEYSASADSSSNVKTQPTYTGSSTFGGAPINHRGSSYYVVVEYLGDNQNYAEAQGYIEFYIDEADNAFYADASQDSFVFKEHKDGDIVIGENQVTMVGTNSSECSAYLEFTKETINSNGLIEVTFKSKFDGVVNSGKLIYVEGAYNLLFADGKQVALSNSVSSGVISDMTVKFVDAQERTLSRWTLPKYLKTFTAQTISEEEYNEDENLGLSSTFTFYNDYGTIRFSANINTLAYDEWGDGQYANYTGGYERWAGVVTVDVALDGSVMNYWLICTIVDQDDESKTSELLASTGFSTSNKQIKFSWVIETDNPTEIKLHASSSQLDDTTYDCLAGTYVSV